MATIGHSNEKKRLAKNAARSRRYQQANPEKCLAKHQKWRDANRERYNKWYREYYAANRERILKQKLAYQRRRSVEK